LVDMADNKNSLLSGSWKRIKRCPSVEMKMQRINRKYNTTDEIEPLELVNPVQGMDCHIT
jgi:hypothetical protein